MIDTITYENIGGIKCCIINKPEYLEKQAMIAFKYGSSNNEFIINNNQQKYPFGIAHFLEHKMFEQQNYNVFDEFNKLGANVNAFTNFTTTAYHFSCTQNFNKNFELLLDFVSSPYFTEENVEKEKGIISQEIKMYDDDPYWKGYFNLLCGLFGEDTPLSKDIAGGIDDINQINADMLYSCYKNFYTKDNAIIICCGDFKSSQEIYDTILKKLRINDKKEAIFKEHQDNCEIIQDYVEKKMDIQQIIFNIGFKDVEKNGKIDKDIISSKIMLDIVTGKSSDLYEFMYNKGLIDNSFSFAYNLINNAGFYAFSGNSSKPKAVFSYLTDYVQKIKKDGIAEKDFLRVKNKQLGSFLMQFNFINSIVSMEADFFSRGFSLLEYYENYKNVTIEDVNLKLKNFDLNNYTLSIVK